MAKVIKRAGFSPPLHIDSVVASGVGLEDSSSYRIALDVGVDTAAHWIDAISERCTARLTQGGFTLDPHAATILHVYLTEGSGLGFASAWYYDLACSKEVLFATSAGWRSIRAVVWARRNFRFFATSTIGCGPHLRDIPYPLLAEFLVDYHRANGREQT